MTDAFTLAGTVADLGLEVRAGEPLRLTAEPSEWVDEDGVYYSAPPITTDVQGRICLDEGKPGKPVAAETPDVTLVVGPRYAISHGHGRFRTRYFLGTADATVDLKTIPLDPPDLPAAPTWHAEIDRLDQRIDDLPATGGGGPAYDDTQVRADFATADAATLAAANTHADNAVDGAVAALTTQITALAARVTALETATANALTLEV